MKILILELVYLLIVAIHRYFASTIVCKFYVP